MLDLSLTNPLMLVGLFVGTLLTFLFSFLTMDGVEQTAQSIVLEVRRQFKEIQGIMDYQADPEYAKCVALCTKGALHEMIAPALVAVIVPINFWARVVGMLGGSYPALHGGVYVQSGGAW